MVVICATENPERMSQSARLHHKEQKGAERTTSTLVKKQQSSCRCLFTFVSSRWQKLPLLNSGDCFSASILAPLKDLSHPEAWTSCSRCDSQLKVTPSGHKAKRERAREQRRTKSCWCKQKEEEQRRAALFLSVLIRVSSARRSGVSECMEAISTPRGRSQTPLISWPRLILSDCQGGVADPTGLRMPAGTPAAALATCAPRPHTLTLGKC